MQELSNRHLIHYLSKKDILQACLGFSHNIKEPYSISVAVAGTNAHLEITAEPDSEIFNVEYITAYGSLENKYSLEQLLNITATEKWSITVIENGSVELEFEDFYETELRDAQFIEYLEMNLDRKKYLYKIKVFKEISEKLKSGEELELQIHNELDSCVWTKCDEEYIGYINKDLSNEVMSEEHLLSLIMNDQLQVLN